MPAGNLTLTAIWTINTYTITFDTDGGSAVTAITQDYNTSITAPEDPTKTGYTFDGWSETVPTTMPAGNLTLTAIWTIKSYAISYVILDNYDPINDIPLIAGETIIQVSLGYNHSSALTSMGRIFTWGANGFGELGNETTIQSYSPIDITLSFNLNLGETIIKISVGTNTSSALTSNGRLFMWGRNTSGQLGDNTTTGQLVPKDITSFFNLSWGESIIQVSIGDFHSSALTSNGRLFMWGYNFYGQLGDNTTTEQLVPKDITSFFNLSSGETIIQVSMGDYHSSALTSNGRLFMWGRNTSGQLGDNTSNNRFVPTQITNQFSLFTGESIIQVSLGEAYSSALTSKGRLFMWGNNFHGQLGDGTNIYRYTPTDITSQFSIEQGEKIILVSLGYIHSLAITSKGKIYAWSKNNTGQLGDGTIIASLIPKEITNQFILYRGETIIDGSLGVYHSAAITSEGRVFFWGLGYNGRLGQGSENDSYSPLELKTHSYYSNEIVMLNFNEVINNYTPSREGYTFEGWYLENTFENVFNFKNMPAQDLILYGKWVPTED